MTYVPTKADRAAIAVADKEFNGFMKPFFYSGSDIEEQIIHAGLDYEADKVYCRLSAPGYMDQTDLSGPYDNAVEAAQSLIDLYGEA